MKNVAFLISGIKTPKDNAWRFPQSGCYCGRITFIDVDLVNVTQITPFEDDAPDYISALDCGEYNEMFKCTLRDGTEFFSLMRIYDDNGAYNVDRDNFFDFGIYANKEAYKYMEYKEEKVPDGAENVSLHTANVSVYKSLYDKIPFATRSLYDMLTTDSCADYISKIRSVPDKNAQKKMRGYLPVFSVGGTFAHRGNENLITPSGFLIVNLSTENHSIEDIKQAVKKLPFVAYCGEGVLTDGSARLVVRIANPKVYKSHFLALKEDFERAGFKVLNSGAIEQPCGVNYDPHPYINEDAKPYTRVVLSLDRAIDVFIPMATRPWYWV